MAAGRVPNVPIVQGVPVMSRIRLVQTRTARVVCDGGRNYVQDTIDSVGVEFRGPDGRAVSVAFDGRCDREGTSCGHVHETFGTYSDCPVIDAHDKQSGPVGELQAMRFLRDALIRMDLGDYDPCAVCDECCEKFDRSERPNSRVCEVCAAKEYCNDCGEYAIVDDEGYCATCNDKADGVVWGVCSDCGRRYWPGSESGYCSICEGRNE